MSTKKKNTGDCSKAVRPASVKSNRPGSSSGGKSSARSTASAESDLGDFLSVSGTRTTFQKNNKHRRSQSGSLPYRSQNESDSESARTSSSSGARKKTININSGGNLRYTDGYNPSKKLPSTSKSKSSLATNFQVNLVPQFGGNAMAATFLPNRPSVTSQESVEPLDDQDWWPGHNSHAPVPPLPELKSPSDLEHKKTWWSRSESGDKNECAKNPGDDNLEEWWTNSMMDRIINSVSVDNGVSVPGNKVVEEKGNEYLQKSTTMNDSQSEAAVIIQKWFRGWRVRRRQGRSAVQQLLLHKKEEKELQLRMSVSEEQLKQQKEAEKIKRREEKARLARQAAIQDLQRKREDKKQGNQRKVEEEMMFLQASGKVTKKKSSTNPKVKPKKPNSKVEKNVVRKDSNLSDAPPSPRPGTAGSTARKVDELFQASRVSHAEQETTSDPSLQPSSEVLTDRTDKTVTSTDVGGSKVTFDDLLESLKQLEEEPEDLVKAPAVKDNTFGGWVKDFSSQEDGGVNRKSYLSAGKLDHLGRPLEEESQPRGSLSAEKLRNILTFLDEVEKAEEDARTEISQARDGARSRGVASPSASVSVAVDREKEEETLQAASVAASDVTNAMMAVKIELEEKKRTADLLQRALNQQREFTVRQAKEMEKDAKQRLAIQRQEYESAIQRHLSFIDQLIDDKKALSERCEELVKKLKEIDHKYTKKITEMEESHGVEMKKQKDVILAAEKLRREKWINEKTQQIKEVTVKGLEPDIQRLIAKHKAEIKKMKSVHQAELLEADERAGRRYIQQIEELRDQLEREKESACTRERELAQQRLEKQMEQEEQAYQQQRRRLYAEVQEEKERTALQAQRQRQELDDARVALEDSHKKSIVEMQASHQKTTEDLERRHQLEMNELKERLEIEKQGWIENYMKKQDALLLTKERELKEGVRDARDREIEMVISRLEEETAIAREECERAAENRIKRVRDKYEAELAELERSERNMHEKYNSMKERLTEVEGECSRQRSLMKQKGQEVEDMEKVTKRLQEERGKVSDIIRQEFADRLVTTEEDNKRLKTDISEMRARHRLEIERITKDKEQEMEEVHKRVKQAISKKEETMKVLREQQQAAMKRADHLEFLLQEQRKKLLH